MAQRSEDTSETLPRPGRRRCCHGAMARTGESWHSFSHYTSLNPTVRRTPSVDVCPEVRYTAMLTVLNDRRNLPEKPRRPFYRGCDTAGPGRAMTPVAEFKSDCKFTATTPQRSNNYSKKSNLAPCSDGEGRKEGTSGHLGLVFIRSRGAHRGPFK
jgi:hypothetical protein